MAVATATQLDTTNEGARKMLKHFILVVLVWILNLHLYPGASALLDRKMRDQFLEQYAKWLVYCRKVLKEVGWSSDLESYFPKIFGHESYKKMVQLGVKALPIAIIVVQADVWVGGVPGEISKFKWHHVRLRWRPGDILVTTEEFPEIRAKHAIVNAKRMWLHWWINGGDKTPIWFEERYALWKDCLRKEEIKKSKKIYQKLLHIGIAAIPLWLRKLQSERSAGLRREIVKALSQLTDGQIKETMTPQECMNWWQRNKDKWTIPFPKGSKDFIEQLLKELRQPIGLPSGIGAAWMDVVVITISRIQDSKAIEVLISLLKHPSIVVRCRALEQLQMLFKEQLPKEYRVKVNWVFLRDGSIKSDEILKARRQLAIWRKRLTDMGYCVKMAKELEYWWDRNRSKVKADWEQVYMNF